MTDREAARGIRRGVCLSTRLGTPPLQGRREPWICVIPEAPPSLPDLVLHLGQLHQRLHRRHPIRIQLVDHFLDFLGDGIRLRE